ncbi:hypothetical protein PUNSTDRAFT_53268 [Punctularia strigosozonata HHB-11173 SS5]|uniref:uncharacterized protein n=1 Tax=Punctularia strigosozonata (strain HHB-11173) TaxID=741275 RepID=UPI00044175BE|nr:uncharacterized protein PUNSTDRAFT_53268 [Punctularia strigosozonata HHB-11173 SS5]EIN07944.1 hypothetical protein PUNSTDRAFT_53268 [Punctularia strigosozonata HHB-11173 SS5]
MGMANRVRRLNENGVFRVASKVDRDKARQPDVNFVQAFFSHLRQGRTHTERMWKSVDVPA